jgi:hypothetical protein
LWNSQISFCAGVGTKGWSCKGKSRCGIHFRIRWRGTGAGSVDPINLAPEFLGTLDSAGS